jgi:choline-sulfatase
MSTKPNILFIMDDQHRFDYLGAAGASFVRTPNIDALAASGIRFTQCTTNAPVCAPSRIGLASGLHPCRLGSLDNGSFLPPDTTSYYQRLRDGGYRVGCVGKLDLAKPDSYNGRYGDRPRAYQWGFTHPVECEGKMHAGSSATPIGPYTHFLAERGLLQTFHDDYRQRRGIRGGSPDSALPTDAFEDSYIGRRAAAWIDDIADDFPWHLFVSFVGPHDPFDPPTEYADRYRDADMPAAVSAYTADKPDWIARRVVDMTADEIAVSRRQYCAAIELIDDQVGLILAALARRGMDGNTHIIFASDHGEMLGDHGLYTKSVAYEASLRVPLILAGPGIEGGRASASLVELIDVNPTICQLAGLPRQQGIDGRSLVPVVDGRSETHRTETVSALRNFRCLRTERYKLIQNYNSITELYDLAQDPNELRNLADDEPDTVRDLGQRLHQRFAADPRIEEERDECDR